MLGFGYKRAARVGDLILKEISQMILKGEVKDPRISSVVLTGIELADDLSFARVFFTVMDSDNVNTEDVLAGLESASGFIKRELSKRLHLKKIPNLRFEFDSSLNEGWKIERLLKEVKGE